MLSQSFSIPSNLSINRAPKKVHIWKTELDAHLSQLSSLTQSLSQDELKRARAFKFARHQHRFIIARSILRQLLTLYLKCEAEEIQFHYNRYGKPELTPAFPPLHFNLSHSQDIAVYAFCEDFPLGIDVEFIDHSLDFSALAAHFFAPSETHELASVEAQNYAKAFFHTWTSKEAYIKAIGGGLSIPLDSFEVSVQPDQPAGLKSIRGQPEEAARWHLQHFTPEVGYLATLAIRCRDCQFSYWHYPP